MPDENSDKMIRLLEEIRDLTKARNVKVDGLVETMQRQYEAALQRQKEAQERVQSQRRRFLRTLMPLLLFAIGSIAYLTFWVIPQSEQRQMKRQMEETRIMQSNYLSQPR